MKKPDLGLLFVPIAGATFIRLLRASIRLRHAGSEQLEKWNAEGLRYIVAFWHSHLLLMVYCRFARPIRVMVSQHRDGEMITRVMGRFGVDTGRGSTTRGGSAALRQMVRHAIGGENLAFTPDGPRGPRHVVQPGVIAAAQLSGLPIVPVAAVSKKKSCSAPGIGSRFRTRSPGFYFSTANRSLFPAN